MLLVRKFWLLPAAGLVLILYYLWHHSSDPLPIAGQSETRLRTDGNERYPVKSLLTLPTGVAKQLPKIQHDFTTTTETAEAREKRLERQTAVREAFVQSWNGYKRFAWRQDEVTPLTAGYMNPFGGWGASLVDAMDTLWILGMKEDFEQCIRAVEHIDFSHNTDVLLNTFETTIRYLGGILAAYDLSNHQYPSLLQKAVDLAEILYMSFDTPNRLPLTRWRWRDSAHGYPIKAAKATLLAELGSLNLEFTRLAQLTGDNRWFDAVERLTIVLQEQQDRTRIPGLWPTIVDAEKIDFSDNHFTLGGMADSTYEYLPKQYMMLGGLDDKYRTMYDKALRAAKKYIFYRPLVPAGHDILLGGNAAVSGNGVVQTEPQAQHLTCFLSGMVGIGARVFEQQADMPIAGRLVDGCAWAYNSTPTGLMPETFHVAPCHIGSNVSLTSECDWSDDKWYEAVSRVRTKDDRRNLGTSAIEIGRYLARERQLAPGYTSWGDNRYILRPEAIESLFVMYRLTGDPKYPEAAWRMFQAVQLACKTTVAYAAISDVRMVPPVQQDRMESFWLAETLKYAYLIFSEPDIVSLDEWVLNTEAHPLRRPKAGESLVGGQRVDT